MLDRYANEMNGGWWANGVIRLLGEGDHDQPARADCRGLVAWEWALRNPRPRRYLWPVAATNGGKEAHAETRTEEEACLLTDMPTGEYTEGRRGDRETKGGQAMRVLVACEFSGTVRDVFAAKGHEAWSCDLLPSETEGNHIQGDVLELLDDEWDLVIAHPPCTYLTVAGNKYFNPEYRDRFPDRIQQREEAIEFVLWRPMVLYMESPLDGVFPILAGESDLGRALGSRGIGRTGPEGLVAAARA